MFSQYKLECINGSLAGQSFHFSGTGTCQIGRRRGCDLRVREVTVSGYHCELISDGKQILFRDKKSTNGSQVNGVTVSEAVLSDGDTITIGGKCSFRIVIEEEENSSGPQQAPEKEENPAAQGSSAEAEESGECRCELCGRIFPAKDRMEGVNICPHCMDHNQEAVLRFLLADTPTAGSKKEVSSFGLKGYKSLRKLGEGSFGSVWLVEEIASGRHMALKVMLDRATVQDLEIKKFQREMNIASQLDHPNIVGLYGSGTVDGRFYMLQEYCAGGSLFSFIQRTYIRYAGKLPVDLSVDLELQILQALDYAHNAKITAQNILGMTETLHGVIHRDIHPGNIFLAGHEMPLKVKVGDWGLSKAYEMAGMSGISVGDVPTGTQDFGSLQQHMNFRYSGPEVDVWSAAAVLFYMLTGQPPREREMPGSSGYGAFPGVRPVRTLRPDVPKALAEVLDYTLVEQPRLRVLSAAELSGRIRKAMQEAD